MDGRADPSTIVRDIYANKFDTIWPETEEHRSDLLSDSLSASFTKSIRTYGQFALTFDPIINGQDALIEHLVIDSAVVKGDYASVKVRFRNFGEDNVLVYSFVLEDDRWKLDELASIGDDGWLLSEVLQNP